MRSSVIGLWTCLTLSGCDRASAPLRPLSATATLDIHAVAPTASSGTKLVTGPWGDTPKYLTMPPIISAGDVESVQRSDGEIGGPSLAINLTPAGAAKMAAATATPAGQEIAIVINGNVVSVAEIRLPLSSSFVISGEVIARNHEAILRGLTQ